MFIRPSIVCVASFFLAQEAFCQPDPDVVLKIESACESVLKNARDKAGSANDSTSSVPLEAKLSLEKVLSILETQYGYTKKDTERGFLDNPVLQCRLTQPGVKIVKNPQGGPENPICLPSVPSNYGYSDDVLFANDEPAKKIRKTLLSLFASADQKKAFNLKRIAKFNVTNKTKSLPANSTKSEKFISENEMIKDYFAGSDALQFTCVGPARVDPYDNMVDSVVLSAVDDAYVGFARVVDIVASTALPTYERSEVSARDEVENKRLQETGAKKEPKFTRDFKIVKNPEAFAQDDPDGFVLGTDIDAKGGTSGFTIDTALGMTFKAIDKAAKCKIPAGDCALKGEPAGSERQYSFYLAYAQAPSTEKVYDRSQFAFPLDPEGEVPTSPLDPGTGDFVVTKSPFADGVLRAGIRVDYDSKPWFTPPGKKEKWWHPASGERPLGSKSSFTLETLTDNQFDLQANRFEATWTPPTVALYNIKGFRHPVGIFGGKSGPEFQWTFNTNIDGTSYARTPRIRDVTNPMDRRDLPDFIRVGIDAQAGLTGRLPQEAFGRGAKWGLEYKLTHRESLAGKAADAFGDEVSLSLEDLWWTKGKFSLTYINEDNAITLNERELYKLGVEFKLR